MLTRAGAWLAGTAVLAALWVGSAAASAPLPRVATEFRLPDAHPVGGILLIDGVAHRIAEFTTPAALDSVLAAVVAAWSSSGSHGMPTATGVDDWHVLGRQVGSIHEAVQLRAGPGGTHGLVTKRGSRRHRPAESPVALPRGARVLRTVESFEAGRHAVQVVARVRLPAARVARELCQAAERAGWRPQWPAAYDACAVVPAMLHLARRDEELSLVVAAEGDATDVVVHTVRAGVAPAWAGDLR